MTDATIRLARRHHGRERALALGAAALIAACGASTPPRPVAAHGEPANSPPAASPATGPRGTFEVGTSDPLQVPVPLYEDEQEDPSYTGPLPILTGDRNAAAAPLPRLGAHSATEEAVARFAAQSCPLVPTDRRAFCPLRGFVTAVRAVDGGALITVTGDARDVVAHIRCHQAYGEHAHSPMPDCPVFIPGAQARAVSARDILFTAPTATDAEALVQRLTRHLGSTQPDGGTATPEGR